MLLVEPSMGATTHVYGDDAVRACHHAPQVEPDTRTKTKNYAPQVETEVRTRTHKRKNKKQNAPQVETGVRTKTKTTHPRLRRRCAQKQKLRTPG